METYCLFSDAGHGWLKVKRAELKRMGIADKITSYSYQKGDDVYLEEDCDASRFLEAYKKKNGTDPRYLLKYSKNISQVRYYDSFKNK